MDEKLNFKGNEEIDNALKEFEVKAQAEQAQENPEVTKTSDVPKMVQLVMKWFKITEQKYAEYILLGFCVVAIGVSLYLFFGNGSNSNQSSLSPEDLNNLPPELVDIIQNAK
jgi:hypothetical protein